MKSLPIIFRDVISLLREDDGEQQKLNINAGIAAARQIVASKDVCEKFANKKHALLLCTQNETDRIRTAFVAIPGDRNFLAAGEFFCRRAGRFWMISERIFSAAWHYVAFYALWTLGIVIFQTKFHIIKGTTFQGCSPGPPGLQEQVALPAP